MKKALVCGAGGFIGGHLVRRLVNEGYWVRGVDQKQEFSKSAADQFMFLDLREEQNCHLALTVPGGFDEVYQLAADMGGMGFIHSAAAEIMHNSLLINLHMTREAALLGVGRYFFSSSACVYRDMQIGEPEMTEEQAYPAMPDNEYGWEKLYSERLLLTYSKKYNFPARIARFQNCFGPYGTWRGGREKAPAAMCRKIAEAVDGGEIEVFVQAVWKWGMSGNAFVVVRPYSPRASMAPTLHEHLMRASEAEAQKSISRYGVAVYSGPMFML